MGTLVETDIDHFIKGHKAKLQQERQTLTDPRQAPSARKQWDRQAAKETRPAEQKPPEEPDETGLGIGNDQIADQRRQQLHTERKQEYNDILAKRGKAQYVRSRPPRTPVHEGLPLGMYAEKRKKLDRERKVEMKLTLDMKAATGKRKPNVYDYGATQREHLEEKKQEYNEYIAQHKDVKGRHIMSPEDGMFVGPDQSERSRKEREKNIKYRRQLEKQKESHLRNMGREPQDPLHPSPRSQPQSHARPGAPPGPPGRPAQHPPGRPPPPSDELYEERVMDMPKLTPRKIQLQKEYEQVRNDPTKKFTLQRPVQPELPEEQQSIQHRKDPQYRQPHDRPTQDRQYPSQPNDDRYRRGDRPVRESRDDLYYNPSHNDDKHSPRKARSLSPRERNRLGDQHQPRDQNRTPRTHRPTHRRAPGKRRANPDLSPRSRAQPDTSPRARALVTDGSPRSQYDSSRMTHQEKVQRNLDAQMAQKQHLLAEQYQRDLAEEHRLAQDRERDPNFDYSQYKHTLEAERKREYQEFLKQTPTPRRVNLRRKEITPEELRVGLPLDQSRHDEERKILDTERKKEYNELLEKQAPPRPKLTTPEETGLDIGGYEVVSKMLSDERQKEYQARVSEQEPKRKGQYPEGTAATLPVGEYDDTRRNKLYEERHNEYLQQQEQKEKVATGRRGLPPKPATPDHFFKTVGMHDRARQGLNDERKKEYNKKLAEDRVRTTGHVAPGAENYIASVPIRQHDSAERRKTQTRNDEYNQFLKEKKEKDAHRFDNKKPPVRPGNAPPSPVAGREGVFATLPGLHYTDSAEKRKMAERNRDYNDFLSHKDGAKRHGQTPTYEDILTQKRQEEMQRRHSADPGYDPPKMRSYASEGAINQLEDQFRQKQLDKEYEARKVRFEEDRQGILDDDDWLNPQKREEEYQHLEEKPVVEQQPEMAARVQQRQQYNASLPLGGDERDSAKRRRQSDYRRELQLQMEESAAARKREISEDLKVNLSGLNDPEEMVGGRREKREDLRVNATGLLDPEKSSRRMRDLGDGGGGGSTPRREYKSKEVQPYHTKFLMDDSDDYDALGPTNHRGRGYDPSSRPCPAEPLANNGRGQGRGMGGYGNRDISSANTLSDVGDNFQLDLGGGGGGGFQRGRARHREDILDTGFQGLLESRRPAGGIVNPPAGIMYTPTFPASGADRGTYVTAGGGESGPYNNSIDQAYHYLGMKNPLDADLAGAGGGGGGAGIPGLNLGGPGPEYGHGPRSPPSQRVTFADSYDQPVSHRKRDRSNERISPYQFTTDDDNRAGSRTGKVNYQHDLERQIADKRYRKQKEKDDNDKYERKLEEDIKNYTPFGRSGGGAPIRDSSGQAIADLRSLQHGDPGYVSPRKSPDYSPRPPSPRDDKVTTRPPPVQQNAIGESTYARGGHGIFGVGKTDTEKHQSDVYKDELKQQIESKRRDEQRRKEEERMVDEKENRRLEDQRKRMQEDYEQELKKIRSREDETRKKNEEIRKQAEDKKKDAETKRREADDRRMREQQEEMEHDRQAKQQTSIRSSSPPVPAIKSQEPDRVMSPPVPAVRVQPHHPPPQPAYQYYQQGDDPRSIKSPPLPAQRRAQSGRAQDSPVPGPSTEEQQSPRAPRPIERADSSDVLTQLASMRQKLVSERRRVENALENSKNQPDVFDPRVIQRPPPNPQHHPPSDVFEKAINRNAAHPPPRAQTSDLANARALEDFTQLKFNDTESRHAFRDMFPDIPTTNTTLETQQEAMLRHQSNVLRSMKDRSYRPSSAPRPMNRVAVQPPPETVTSGSSTVKYTPPANLKARVIDPFEQTPPVGGRRGNVSARSNLPARSAFIDVDGINHFPPDFEDLPARNESARSRRRDRFSPRPSSELTTYNGMGSQTSLDVERIQKKNEDRLRRLQNMAHGADDLSLGDPDEVLDRFMARQRYERCASGQTLQDDTWLRPGSKII